MKMSYRRHSSGQDPEPLLQDYQLIGDSQFLRFAEQLLGKYRKKSDGFSYVGFCVSGQKISDLLKRVRGNFSSLTKKAVVMIGTNDLLQGTSITDMCNSLNSLLDELFNKGVTKIVLLTVPPVPRLANSCDHWRRLKEYNKFIMKRHDGEEIIAINAYAKFVKANSRASGNHRSSISSLECSRASGNHRSSISSLDSSRANGNHRPSISSRESSPCKRREPSGSCLIIPSNLEVSKVKSNIRVSIGEKRKVYVLSSDSDESTDLTRPTKRRLSPSENRYSAGEPPLKRRSYSTTFDDHDDSFGEDDSFSALDGLADDIHLDYFEEFFSRVRNRKDLIHFNYDGLRVIRRLILNVIDP